MLKPLCYNQVKCISLQDWIHSLLLLKLFVIPKTPQVLLERGRLFKQYSQRLNNKTQQAIENNRPTDLISMHVGVSL